MSIEAYSKAFFEPRVTPSPIEVKPQFLKADEKAPSKGTSFQGSGYGLKNLQHVKWQPKHLAKPSFLVDKVASSAVGKNAGEYELAKDRYEKARGEAEKSKANYEKLANGAKAFKAMDNEKQAKAFSALTAVAKNKFEQKANAANIAKHQMEKIAAKAVKPPQPAKGMAPAGEELTEPSNLTLAKNHSVLSGKAKGAV